VNFRIKNEEALTAVDGIAASLGRDRSWVLNEALDAYLEIHGWQMKHIKKGLQQSKAKQFAKPSDVDALLRQSK
jgi:predicted transcriptional regulator